MFFSSLCTQFCKMYSRAILSYLFFSVLFTVPIISARLFGNEVYSFSILNHDKVKDKVNLIFYRGEKGIIKSTVNLNKIQPQQSIKSKKTYQVISIEAWCKDKQKECLRLLKSDINVLVLTEKKSIDYKKESSFFCKRGKTQSSGYEFTPCFRPLSSKALLDKANDGYVHIVCMTGDYSHQERFIVRLLKTDGSEVKIFHSGLADQQVLDSIGTPAHIREILIDAGSLDHRYSKILVFVEGRQRVDYLWDNSKTVDGYYRYLPAEFGKLIFQTDRDSTGPKPHRPLHKENIIQACSSGDKLGALWVLIHQDSGESIRYKLELDDICRGPEPSIAITFPFISIVTSVEAYCENSEDACQQILNNDLHVMPINYPQMYESTFYFCKREILPSGKYLYLRCWKKMSSIARKQKKQDEFVHLVYLDPDYKYERLGSFIQVVKNNGIKHTIERKVQMQRDYYFLGSTSPIDHILVDMEEYYSDMTRIKFYPEANDMPTYYCLDNEQKKINDMWKFIRCNQ